MFDYYLLTWNNFDRNGTPYYSDKVNYVFEGTKFPKGGHINLVGNMALRGAKFPRNSKFVWGGQISWDTGIPQYHGVTLILYNEASDYMSDS
jgi:hypothetical protein